MTDQRMATIAAQARSLVRGCDSGTLATHFRSHPGYPFASLAAFASDRDARPVMLVSQLAEHSRNLAADPHASLLVRRAWSDPQAQARVTLLANAAECEVDTGLRQRYARQVPGAGALLELGDFFFIRMQPVAIRFIGGFGAIHWIDSARYVPLPSEIPDCEQDLLATIASDHADELRSLAQRSIGRQVADVSAIGIDGEGMDLRADGERLRVDFAENLSRAVQVHQAIAALARGVE